MKTIFTGMNGTVAPVVAHYFKEQGAQIIAYDRSIISTNNRFEIESFIHMHQPDALLHFAMGAPEWAEMLASICEKAHIKFIFISTSSVFDASVKGPITTQTKPHAEDPYGSYKITSEEKVKSAHPNAYIIRIGWQIGHKPGSNQMIDFLTKAMEKDGVIHASTKWYPSCSFIEDSAEAIYDIVTRLKPDTYLVNSNDGYSFFEIVSALKKMHPLFDVKPSDEPNLNHLMIDDRPKMTRLSERFKHLTRIA